MCVLRIKQTNISSPKEKQQAKQVNTLFRSEKEGNYVYYYYYYYCFSEKRRRIKDLTETCLSSLWKKQMKKSESERH